MYGSFKENIMFEKQSKEVGQLQRLDFTELRRKSSKSRNLVSLKTIKIEDFNLSLVRGLKPTWTKLICQYLKLFSFYFWTDSLESKDID